MVHLEIDGQSVTANPGATVLSAARAAGIPIPTLCHHEALEPWGGCRLCVVETGADGAKALEASCCLPATEGLVVSTRSEAVLAARRTVLDLLLARCPGSDVIRRLALEHGVKRTSHAESDLDTTCILCSLCVRVCEKIGANAIGTAGRGRTKRIAPPFDLEAADCIGCLSCVRVCPTDAIPWEETEEVRKIWGRTFRMVKCEVTGKPLMTEEQVAFEAKRAGLDEDYFTMSPEAKKRKTAETIAAAFRETR
jgi:NADH dehydrogenase/NADH:ubiquinone oxidoreductase subunit G